MSDRRGAKRVLVAAGPEERARLGGLFAAGGVPGWEADEADTFERARFLVQLDPPDVLLLDASLCPEGDTHALGWLGGGNVPIVFLSPADPDLILNALSHGAHQWLPRDLVADHPVLLAVALHRADGLSALRRQADTNSEALADCRQRVNRLVNLLWAVTPGEWQGRWFPQRHMLERLEEELARARRHGGPLSIVLAEMSPRDGSRLPLEQAQELAGHTARFIGRHKRISDVAGQYGLNGFVLVMPRVEEHEAEGCCRRLKALLEHPPQDDLLPAMHTHFGLASFSSTSTVQGILRQAEESLERNKQPEE